MPLLRYFTLAALLSLPLASVSAQSDPSPYVLSERVGSVIEPSERAYFGLFPYHREGFEAARFIRHEDRVQVHIQHAVRQELRVAIVSLSQPQAEAMGRLVDTFEDYPYVLDNPAAEMVADYVDADAYVPHAGRNRRVMVDVARGRHEDVLLYASDSFLVMAPTVRSPDREVEGAYALRTSDVERVYLDRRERRWLLNNLPYWGAGLSGVAVQGFYAGDAAASTRGWGTAAAILTGYTVFDFFRAFRNRKPAHKPTAQEVRGWAVFGAERPPEFPSDEVIATWEREPPEPVPPSPPPRRLWWSIGVQGQASAAYSNKSEFVLNETVLLTGGNTQSTRTGLSPEPLPLFRMELAVRPIPWVRGGVRLAPVRERQELGDRAFQEYIAVEPGRYQGYVEAVVPIFRVGPSSVDVAAGIGMETNLRRVELHYPDRFRQDGASVAIPNPPSFTAAEEGANMFMQATVEVASSPRTSLYVQRTWRSLPSIAVPAFSVEHINQPGLVLYSTSAHEVEFGYTEIVFGTRLRF